MGYQRTNLSTFTGRAGEYATAAQLLSRGIMVHFPAVDKDVDLIAGNSIRIQVKTSRRAVYRNSGYVFGLGCKRIGKHASKSKYLRDYSKVVDFLVCCGLDDNKFWVLPAGVLAKFPTVQSLMLGTAHHGLVDTEKLHKLLASGMRQCDVAREMGIHPVTVSEHARGRKHTKSKFSHILAVEADKYENAWHEIEAAVRSTQEIDLNEAAEEVAQETI